ncbi:MAG TPA: DMT family transporter [Dissulfurispiraceae bacterium]|nr:DMT family transporter [Dissulfurispiraceae bacterium]
MIYVIIALLLWSSLGILVRLSGLDPVSLIFFPCAVSLLPLGIVMHLRREAIQPVTRTTFTILVLLSMAALINTGSFFFAYRNTTIANAVLTHYTAPVFVALLAPLILKERLTIRVLCAVLIAVCGLWLMLGVSLSDFADALLSGDADSAGISAGLISGLAYAFVILIIRKGIRHIDPLLMTFGQNLLLLVFLMPVASVPEPFFPPAWYFAALGLIHSSLAPALYFRGLRDVTANKAAVLGYLEPLAAISLAALVLHEPIGFNTMAGGGLILLSGWLIRRL